MREYQLSFDSGAGKISVGEEETVLETPEKTIKFPSRYARSVEIGDSLPLGKVKVKFVYYDLLATENTVEFAMTESDARGLKQELGK